MLIQKKVQEIWSCIDTGASRGPTKWKSSECVITQWMPFILLFGPEYGLVPFFDALIIAYDFSETSKVIRVFKSGSSYYNKTMSRICHPILWPQSGTDKFLPPPITVVWKLLKRLMQKVVNRKLHWTGSWMARRTALLSQPRQQRASILILTSQ